MQKDDAAFLSLNNKFNQLNVVNAWSIEKKFDNLFSKQQQSAQRHFYDVVFQVENESKHLFFAFFYPIGEFKY